MSKLAKTLLTVAGISFLFNIVWENLQALLYKGYSNFWQHFSICFNAALGDVAIILLLYLFLAVIHKSIFWVTKVSVVDVLLLIIAGAVIAIGIEKWALDTGRWQYASAMAIIPYIEVGLLPVIQMMLLPSFSFYLTKKIHDNR